MAISSVNLGGDPAMIGVNGVFDGQTSPELLGMASLCSQVKNFWIGFDTRICPTIVRIYFEPPATWDEGKPIGNYDQIGLIQIGRITYQGVPIPPRAFGMGLDYLEAYNCIDPTNDHNQHRWVDMMDVNSVNRYAQSQLTTPRPLFAYNGFLRNPDYKLNDFFSHPKPNGCLTRIPVKSDTNASLCASLFDAIDFDLNAPPEATITDLLRRKQRKGVRPFIQQSYSHDEVLQTGPLLLALRSLDIRQPEAIEDIQVAGPHMIIYMKDKEAEGPVFIAFFDKNRETQTQSTMLIYTAEDELEQLRFATLTDTFQRIQTYFQRTGFATNRGFPNLRPRARGRGGKGLHPFPFVFNDNINPEIAFNYNTVAVGIRGNTIASCFGCLEWTVSREFDIDSLEFGPLEIWEPRVNDEPFIVFELFLDGSLGEDGLFIKRTIDQFSAAVQGNIRSITSNPYFFEDNSAIIPPNSPAYGDGTKTWRKRNG